VTSQSAGNGVDLRERVAIVTGGGRGIGRSIALGYAQAGADVIISVARNRAEADAVAAESASLPGHVEAVQADVTVGGEVERVVQAALALRGRIDVLVNNAARGMRFVNERFMTEPRPFWEADPVAWRMVIETNVVGVFLVTHAVVPHMLGAGGGSIINVTINTETMVRRGFSPYGPSKAALEAMTRCWEQELEGTGVAINLLAPGGATATGMIPDDASPETRAHLLDPAIMGPPAVWLASADAAGVHGRRIVAKDFRPS
jgi:3-oxoacyl-[acyl-carrier protein] reductase